MEAEKIEVRTDKQKENLFKMLAYAGRATPYSWDLVCKIVKAIAEGHVLVLEKKWEDRFRAAYPETYPLDLSVMKTWSTMDGCVDFRCTTNPMRKLMCDVRVYEGNSRYGFREDLRFTAKLVLPEDFIFEIESNIQYAMDQNAAEAYENHLEAEKQMWMNNYKKEVLNLKFDHLIKDKD